MSRGRTVVHAAAAALVGYAAAAIATRVLEPVAPNDPEVELSDNLVRCAGCGVRGRWEGERLVNAEDHDVPPLCSFTNGRRHRDHGPWLPEPV